MLGASLGVPVVTRDQDWNQEPSHELWCWVFCHRNKNNTAVNHCFWNLPMFITELRILLIMCIPAVRSQTAIYLEEGWILNFYWYGHLSQHLIWITFTMHKYHTFLFRKQSLAAVLMLTEENHKPLPEAWDIISSTGPTWHSHRNSVNNLQKTPPLAFVEGWWLLLFFFFWYKLLCSLGWLWAPNVAKADSKLFFCLFIQCWGSNWTWNLFLSHQLW